MRVIRPACLGSGDEAEDQGDDDEAHVELNVDVVVVVVAGWLQRYVVGRVWMVWMLWLMMLMMMDGRWSEIAER